MADGPGPLGRRAIAALAALGEVSGEPTGAQRAALKGWPGWGPVARAFKYLEGDGAAAWAETRDALKALTLGEEWDAGAKVIDNAFYTPPAIAAAVWELVTALGFTGGRVLEPGAGNGVFLETAPDGLALDWTAIEADPVTARIARALHPGARVIAARLERTALRVGAFDLVVGNVPFGKYQPYDAGAPPGLSVHDYFIWRALQATRPGGLVVLITSRWTSDARESAGRRELARLGRLIGLIRLPSGAFRAAGTGAVEDIIVLRRRLPDDDMRETEQWASTAREFYETTVNGWLLDRPEMVLGELRPLAGKQFGQTLEVAAPGGADEVAMLGEACTVVADRAGQASARWVPLRAEPSPDDVDPIEADGKEGAFTLLADGRVTQRRGGRQVPVKAAPELVALIQLRDAAQVLVEAETADGGRADDEVLRPLREGARSLYEAYVAGYGPLNRCTISEETDQESGAVVIRRSRPAMGGFRSDPDYPLVLALELFDDDRTEAAPGPILLRRVNEPARRITSTSDPREALAVCMDELGRVDVERIGQLLGMPAAWVPNALGDAVFLDPEDREWKPADEYLSGNVRRKLVQARAAAGLEPGQWARNVEALEAVQPAELRPEQIRVQLGSPWVPGTVVTQFIYELLGVDMHRDRQAITVKHEPFSASWEVKGSGPVRSLPNARTVHGTERVNALDLIQHALNGSAPVVYDTAPAAGGGERRVRNEEQTQIAGAKLRALQEQFGAWLWSDAKRAARLLLIYNETYNTVRIRAFDGSGLTFPGLDSGFVPYQSQRDMVARMVHSPSSLCGHAVGAGKTAAMVMGAMTLRRLGLVNKPAMLVPKHLLEQAAADARRLYPGARVLMVRSEDLSPKGRRGFLARVACTDWDLVVMTHQQFTAIPVAPETEAAYVADQIERYDAAIRARGLEGTRTVKRLATAKKRLEAQHERLLDSRRDDGLLFERTGIDWVMVDEAHFYKNLCVPARAEGFSLPGCKRSDDLIMKITYLRRRNPRGRWGALFTGTPLSNSLAEAFVLLKYLCPGELDERGLSSFDAWAALHVVYGTRTEVAPDGSGFRQYRRPWLYCNLPELRLMLGQYADVRTRADLGLEGPKVRHTLVAVDGTATLVTFTRTLVDRADAIRRGWVDPREDNMLEVCGDGRAAALDLRLVGFDPEVPNKVLEAAKRIAGRYRRDKDRRFSVEGNGRPHERAGAFQLVFCDRGTPGPRGDQVYGWLRDALVAQGVPRELIAFVHSAQSDLAKKELFARCRDGRIAVLIGSTGTCGTGVNVQHRLVAIHHLDAPWRPADVEQRNGRGDRPGNTAGELEVVTYVTKNSFDAYVWQALERKWRFISQIVTGELSVREVEDVADPRLLSYAEIKAIATGQPLLVALSEVNGEIARLRILRAAHEREQARLRDEWGDAWNGAREQRHRADTLRDIAESAAGKARVLSVLPPGEEGPISERAAVADRIRAAVEEGRASLARQPRRGGRPRTPALFEGIWRGVKIKAGITWERDEYEVYVEAIAAEYQYGLTFSAPSPWKRGGPARLLDAIDKFIDQAEQNAAAADRAGEGLRARASAVGELLGGRFDGEAELESAIARRDEIEREIDASVVRPAGDNETAGVAA